MKRLLLVMALLVMPLAAQVQPQVIIAWDAPLVGNVDSYNVYRSIVSGVFTTKLNSAPILVKTYTDTAVTRGTTYFYVVRSVNSAGESPNSNQITVTVPNVLPDAPINLRVISVQ